jgi:hypothetical protein
LAWRVSVTALPDTTVALETVTTDVLVEIAPTVTVTVGSVEVTALPPIVALIVVAEPAVTPVRVAVYLPFRLSVVAPIVPVLRPPEAVKTTVSPPLVRLFPAASLAWSVRVTVPPDATVGLETVTTEVLVETDDGETVTLAVCTMATPLIVAETVFASATVELSVPVATPVALVVPAG